MLYAILSIAPCIYDEIDRNDSEIGKHPYAISIKADESGLANVLPMQLVQGVWGKAMKLLQKYNSNVCSAPSAIANVKAFSVLSQSRKDRVPYYVEIQICLMCNGQCSHVNVTCTYPMFKPMLLSRRKIMCSGHLFNGKLNQQNQVISYLLQLLA